MKILIDECLPRKLKNALSNHDVQTVPQAGWAGEKNGELLVDVKHLPTKNCRGESRLSRKMTDNSVR
jgi:hypothetical protein